ncbi:YkvA family protein [Priestia koreensis]|uniref:YkvA family protein n=1 Tax=Priestia koreensis TaxID=284581 RepID=UPI00203CE116|nr:YkvA family protein [Priestia koreensis]MCM3004289.1 YkvA family protein [Priestia koreensis]
MKRIKLWAKKLKQHLFILYFAYKDGRVPLYAKLFTAGVVAYAFSPIDLIPDFIPIIGYLDDLVFVPLGIILALKMIPQAVLADCEKKANEMMKNGKPKNWVVGTIILALWALFALWFSVTVYKLVK